MKINYDGMCFRSTEKHQDGTSVTAAYHQDGDLVWAESSGGNVRHCLLAGVCGHDGVITIGYTMILNTGQLVIGHCVSQPELLEDGRIRLREEWQRYNPVADSGVSYIEEAISDPPQSDVPAAPAPVIYS